MLISIGSKSKPADLVGLLLECHQRIRSFVRLAEEVGRRDDVPESEVVEACHRCERYFTEAFPLHVEDEEKSLLPRVRGLRPDIDHALLAMQAQHRAHDQLLQTFLAALRTVRRDPGQARHREELRAIAKDLHAELETHLTLEEQVIFPAIRSEISGEVQARVLDELRARRRQ